MSNKMIIYFLGPEGSGKSTIINFIYNFLRIKKYKVKIVRELSSHHFIVRFLLKFLSRYLNIRLYSITLVSRLWEILLIIDLFTTILLSFLRVHIFTKLGYHIICERYLIDSIIDCLYIDYKVGINRKIKELYYKLIYLIIGKNKLLIYLNADYQTLISRYKVRGTNIEPHLWIFFQSKLHKKFYDIIGGYMINTNDKTIRDTFRDVIGIFNFIS